MVCNQSLGTQITMLQCTNIAGGWIKGAKEKAFVFIHQHDDYVVTWKPPLSPYIHLIIIINYCFSKMPVKKVNEKCMPGVQKQNTKLDLIVSGCISE